MIARSTSIRSPPVSICATIFGTFPSWCTAWRVRPDETAATPSRPAISFACASVKVSCVPGRKKSWTKCVPALPSLERSVITAWFASTTSRAAAAAEGPAARILLRRARHGQVGTDARERVERRALRLVETPREARDRDHEADADGQAEQRQDRAASTADQLGAQVAEVEHTRSKPPRSKSGVRLAVQRRGQWGHSK